MAVTKKSRGENQIISNKNGRELQTLILGWGKHGVSKKVPENGFGLGRGGKKTGGHAGKLDGGRKSWTVRV